MATAVKPAPSVLDAALAYAERGWPVFPCHSQTKRPLTEHGFHDASCDPATIRAWWRKHPDAMVAAPTGSPIGMWVGDVDEQTAFEAACDFPLPATRKATSGDGYHLYFSYDPAEPIRNAQKTRKGWAFPELPGFDVRGDGGYIILPPSRHPSGRLYQWVRDEDAAEAPAELLRIVRKIPAEKPAEDPWADVPTPIDPFAAHGNDLLTRVYRGQDHPYCLAALTAEADAIRSAGAGEQEGTLNGAALKMGHYVGGGVLGWNTAMGSLIAAGMAMTSFNPADKWTVEQITAKVDRALRAGMAEPKTPPPPSLKVVGNDKRDDGAYREQAQPRAIAATPYAWCEPETIPLRPWVLGRWLLRGVVTAVIAPGGVGKTTLLCGTALSLVTGQSLLGKTVWEGRKRIWIWNLEDAMVEMQRSVQATAKHYGITREDVDGWLFVNTAMEGSGLCTAREDENGFRLLEPIYEAITAELIARSIDVLVIDPFVSSHEVDENANSRIDKIAKAWARVANDANCCIVLIHHTSKAGAAEVTALSARGAKALTDACRATLVLNRMDPETADRFGFDDQERRRYFTVQDDKHNRAPAENADWFKLVSTDLGNGVEGASGDSIGVATPWSTPDPFDGLTGDHLYRVQQKISVGAFRFDPQSRNEPWAGTAIADVLGIDLANKPDRVRVSQMLKTWISNGALVVEEDLDPKRERRKYVRVGHWQNDASAPAKGAARQGAASEATICRTTTPPLEGAGGAGSGRGEEFEVRQKAGGWNENPALGRQRAPILAPGESLDDPVPGWGD